MAKMKCPEGVPDWILTYGDMMSLLLCFFIMLYAISSLEIVKIDAVIESLSESFGTAGSSVEPRNRNSSSTRTSVSQNERAGRQLPAKGGQTVQAPFGDKPLMRSVRPNADQVKASVIPFDVNSDALTDAAKEILAMVGQTIADSPYLIGIEGHASPRERDGSYTAQCDLAFARAVEVRNYLISLGVRENLLVVQVVGPYAPVGETSAADDPIARNAIVQVVQLLGLAHE
ncbi:MAG: OmpA/MotB family protein [Thermoguttaceae bacterium]